MEILYPPPLHTFLHKSVLKTYKLQAWDIGVHSFIRFLLSAQAYLKTPIDHLPAAPGLLPLCMADIVKIPKLFAGGHMSINICRYRTYCNKKVWRLNKHILFFYILLYYILFYAILFLRIRGSVIHLDPGSPLIEDPDPAWTFLWTLKNMLSNRYCGLKIIY